MTFDCGTVGYGATPHVHLVTRRFPSTEADAATSAPGSRFPVICRPGPTFRCVRASTDQLREADFMHQHALAPCVINRYCRASGCGSDCRCCTKMRKSEGCYVSRIQF